MTSCAKASKLILASLLALSMGLGGCATDPAGSVPEQPRDAHAAPGSTDADLAPEQQALRRLAQDYSGARLAILEAARSGLLAFALTCATAENREACLSLMPFGVESRSAYLTRDHQGFVATPDSLQQDIAAARAETDVMQRNRQAAQAVLALQRRELGRIDTDRRAGRLDVPQARAQAAGAAGDVRAVRALAEESDRRVASLDSSIAAHREVGLPTGELDAERFRQKTEASTLRRIERGLVLAIDRIPADIRPPAPPD